MYGTLADENVFLVNDFSAESIVSVSFLLFFG